MELAFIDIFFLVILIFTVINAAIKGFVHEFFSKAAFFLGIFIAAVFYPKLDVYISRGITIEILSKIISFIVIFIAVYLVVRLVQIIVKKAFSGEIMSGLDHSLGVFVGIAEGVILIALVLVILYMQPWFDVTDVLKNSIFHKFLKGILSSPVNEIKEMVGSSI